MPRDSRDSSSALSIGELMADPQGDFGKILRRARAIDRLDRKVRGLLDVELSRHCRVANVREGRMIFACTSPGCATRLRMQAPRLLEDLHAAGLEDIEAIEVKLTPERHGRREEGD